MGKVYTKTGDRGNTTLYGGTSVSKDSLRVKTYGSVDEANVAIGIAKTKLDDKVLIQLLEVIQLKLFEVAAEIASDEEGQSRLHDVINLEDVAFLEKTIDELSSRIPSKNYFMIPGKTEASANLHGARVAVRRAERELIALSKSKPVRDPLMKYLNRLSDLFFILSRYVDESDYKENDKGRNLDLETTAQIEKICQNKAKEMGIPMAIAFVDEQGHLIRFSRMKDTLLVSSELAINKAYTAAALKMTTEKLGKIAKPGEFLYGIENEKRMVIFGGGIPLYKRGKLVGAIGVSGGTVEEDIIVATIGASYFDEGSCD
ncbi:MAG: cob(I)yrinic acid a,c-diamide adenosyltransferase [Tissierellia bacterium]|nr:cob(I)yrinic acid a,c-diamide adenosyltransferase [Tissierellia bacterium]